MDNTLRNTFEYLFDSGIGEIWQSARAVSDSSRNQTEEKDPLAALRKKMEAFDECALKRTARNFVFSDGDPSAEVMLVGEAPGADEDAQGRPFVGQSGQLLTKAFSTIGFPRSHLYITNVLPYRPPGNRQPTPREIDMFLPFLYEHIQIVSPKILVLVGGTAVKAVLGISTGITRIRGKWVDSPSVIKGVGKVMPIYHPAYLLRSPLRKRELWHDLLTIRKGIKA